MYVRDRESEGTVREEFAPRSYTVETPNGTVRRNRRDVIQFPLSDSSPTTEQATDSNTDQPISNSTRSRSGKTLKPHERYDSSWTHP